MSTPVVDAYVAELLAPVESQDMEGDALLAPSAIPAADGSVAPLARVPVPVERVPVGAPVAVAAHARDMMRAAPAVAPATLPPATTLPAQVQPGRWLRLSVEGDHYAVELLRVQEVVRLVPIMAMRGANPAVLGVMNLRGRIVPVYDLGRWLGAGEVHPDERARIVVVERDDELLGVLASAVDDVFNLVVDAVEPLQPTGPQQRRNIDRAFLGIARPGNVPTVLLDANALFV